MRTDIPVLFLCVAGLLLLALAPVRAEREIEEVEERTFTLAQAGTVKISAADGYIHMATWEKDTVVVKMTKHALGDSKGEAKDRLEAVDVVIEQYGNRLTIRERHQDDRTYSFFDLLDPDRWDEFGGRIAWVDFDLTIPRKTSLFVTTDEGDISVADLWGDMDLKTDEGHVELRQIRSDGLFIMTDEGDIILNDIRPEESFDSSRLEINSDESEIELYGIEMGRVRIESDEGDVIVKNIRCNHLDYRSDEGNIELSSDIQPHGDYRCRTDEGEILLFLPGDSSFRITASSQEGRIRSDFPLDIKDREDGQRADDTIGTGAADLYLFSEEGDIQLRRR